MRLQQFLLVLFLLSCIDENRIPDDVLRPQKMSEILTDFHLLESKLSNLDISRDSASVMYVHFEPQIYAKHDVDSAHYQESLKFYMSRPKLIGSIYGVIVDSLSVRETARRIN